MVRSTLFQSQDRSHPDPIRIAAISAAITFNIAVLALLMRPPEFNTPTIVRDDNPTVTFVTPNKKIEPPPIIKVVKHEPRTIDHPAIAPVIHERIPPVINEHATAMSTDVPPQTDTRIGDDILPVVSPPVEAALNAIASPAPTYPRDALRDGITGTVELQLLVGVDGRVVDVQVISSSGNRELDRAAREQVLRNWRFQPAMRDGVAIQSLGRVPIVFSLDQR